MEIHSLLDQLDLVPHLWLKVERDMPSQIFIVALVGVPSILMVALPRLLSMETIGTIVRDHYATLRVADQGEGKMVPCFGRVLGYYYHHAPGVCHEYNVCGDLIGYYDGFPPHYGEIATLEVVENDQ